jgi:hypothetical protein
LLNKLSSYKLRTYTAFVNSLGQNAHVDLTIYHCDPKIFLDALHENMGRYDHYVIMPHFKDEFQLHQNISPEILEALQSVPEDKLLILDNHLSALHDGIASVYQDFKMDIYDALAEGVKFLQRYTKLILVYPRTTLYPYPADILHGFQKFCADYGFSFEVLEEIDADMDLRARDAYIIIEEMDLVSLVKQIRDKSLVMGEDIGVISYNDTPLKDLLGITVISTDFQVMGETAAYMLLKRKREQVKNVFRFINRNSV